MPMPLEERQKEFVNSLARILALKSVESEASRRQKLLVETLWALAEKQLEVDRGESDDIKLKKYVSRLERTEEGRGLMNLATSLKELIEDDGIGTRTALVRFLLKKG